MWSPVDCYEVHGSIRESTSQDGESHSVQLQCAWDDRRDLVEDILGNRRLWPYGGTARAASAGVMPIATTGEPLLTQHILYDQAIVTVNYNTKEPEDLYSESIESTIEFQTQDYRDFRWTSQTGDMLTETEAPGVQKRGLVLTRNYLKVEPPLPTTLLTLVGCCNDVSYVSSALGLTFAAETLLYNPPTLSRTITSDFNPAFNIGLKFVYNPEGWNKYYRAKTDAYEIIWNYVTNLEHKNYPPADMTGLLF